MHSEFLWPVWLLPATRDSFRSSVLDDIEPLSDLSLHGSICLPFPPICWFASIPFGRKKRGCIPKLKPTRTRNRTPSSNVLCDGMTECDGIVCRLNVLPPIILLLYFCIPATTTPGGLFLWVLLESPPPFFFFLPSPHHICHRYVLVHAWSSFPIILERKCLEKESGRKNRKHLVVV